MYTYGDEESVIHTHSFWQNDEELGFEPRTEEELIEYKRLIGMPLAEDYDELIASLKTDIPNTIENDSELKKLLSPMINLLDEKNITKAITIVKENNKLYICFNKDYLSDSNKLILEKISFVYSETIFYSDNKYSPNSDRLEYWCPDEEYDKTRHITERCRNKKMFVLEFDLKRKFTILGTTIMLSDTLQEQDPMTLKANENLEVYDADIIERHEHYISSGCPDSKWLNLVISLNKDNPLMENPYATFMSVCEINTPVTSDNLILTMTTDVNDKKYLNFCMEKEDLEKVIKEYFGRKNKNEELDEIKKKLLND